MKKTLRPSMCFYCSLLSLTFLVGLMPSVNAGVPPPTSAGGIVDLWMHQVPQVKTPPVIDGQPDDPCWKTLPVLSNFTRDRFSRSTHPMFPMAMQLGFDNTYIYCLWKLSNPPGTNRVDYAAWKKRQDDTKHDSAMYWNTPSLEFRVDGRFDRLGETMIQMNMVNQKQAFQLISTGWSCEYAAGFDLWGDYQYASGFDENGWWVELKVALKDLGAEARPGYLMGGQFRYFHLPGVYFAWTPAGYSVSAYGILLLVEEPIPTEKALELIFPAWRNMTIRMPQADKVVLVERGKFSETSYQDAVIQELNGLKQKRRQLDEQSKAVTGLDPKATFGDLDKKLADIEADVAKITAYSASDMTRLRQPMDTIAFALQQAEAKIEIKKLLSR